MSIQEYVVAGAKLLDEKIPDWYEKINLDRLNMSNGRNCIIGQLVRVEGSIGAILQNLGVGSCWFDTEVYKHGYTLKSNTQSYANWELLKDYWVDEINQRLNKVVEEIVMSKREEEYMTNTAIDIKNSVEAILIPNVYCTGQEIAEIARRTKEAFLEIYKEVYMKG